MAGPDLLGGRYELRGVLGHGGMAVVHAGWDRRLNRPVAVKLLHRTLLHDADSRARFGFEATVAAALNHPNIVTVHDSGEHHGVPYLVMEQLPGTSLAEAIARGPMPVPYVRAVLADVLSGLAAAHAAGVLHRDVKPSNVLFGPVGEAKLADFGIAKSNSADITRVGQVVGTMAYLSPDRISGKPASPADDLYAVGAMGYEALTGAMAFPQQDPVLLLRAVAERDVVPLRAARPDVDPVLLGVIERAMSPDASVRFPSADAMRTALTAVRPPTRVLSSPAPPPMTGAVPPPPPPDGRRKVLAVSAVAAAVLLALLLVVVEATTSEPATSEPTPTPTTSSATSSSVVPVSTTPAVLAPPPPQGPPGPGERPGNGNERPKKPKKGEE
ncbi:serine/threonine-protein kinase [Mycolicibacterium sediminis]|uniref:non-specific serine/threonine protein kinase n=1 Tax=Mycolicibacterium sediminis TaxID=1286180 RepID=A0A7I7QI69_9MYCO|nr:serine/threonine-protein kinase [Mycolicibacterium sediminis]BBY25942.1 hypothetical protein MSEDJ_00380 [Mycolicibacterium sediminis]